MDKKSGSTSTNHKDIEYYNTEGANLALDCVVCGPCEKCKEIRQGLHDLLAAIGRHRLDVWGLNEKPGNSNDKDLYDKAAFVEGKGF